MFTSLPYKQRKKTMGLSELLKHHLRIADMAVVRSTSKLLSMSTTVLYI
jgi:hypothetical protein